MKKWMKQFAAAFLAFTMLVTAVPARVAATEGEEPKTNVTLIAGTRDVTTTGDLTVTVPADVVDTYTVSAYQVLQMVRPEGDATDPTALVNDLEHANVYRVTDAFVDFFQNAETTYESSFVDKSLNNTETGVTEVSLYLTYDAANTRLAISDTVTEGAQKNEDYIEIKINVGSRLDADYFGADIISRVTDDKTGTASGARLLSDWLSRYAIKKNLTVAKTATVDSNATEVTNEEGSVTGKQVTLSDLKYGYYLLVAADGNVTGTDADYVINQSILNIPMTTSVNLKSSPITIDKSVKNEIDANLENNNADSKINDGTTRVNTDGEGDADIITANIGDRLEYTVVSQIPDLTSYDLSSYAPKLNVSVVTDSEYKENDSTNQRISDMKTYRYVFSDTLYNQDLEQINTTVTIGNTADGETEQKTYYAFEFVYNGSKRYYYFYEDDLAKAKADEKLNTYNWRNGNYKSYQDAEGKTVTVAADVIPSDDDGETLKALESYAFARMRDTGYDDATRLNTMFINFDLKKIKEHGDDGKQITFDYVARVMNDAGNTDTTNTASVSYSNDPFDETSYDTISDKTNVYTYDLKIQKEFSDGRTDLYDKVYFRLYSQNPTDKNSTTGAIEFIKPTQEQYHEGLTTGTYTDSDGTEKNGEVAVKLEENHDGLYTRGDNFDVKMSEKSKPYADQHTTTDLYLNSTDGTLILHGLGEGTYYLEEYYVTGENEDTIGKQGYRLVNTVTITITAKNRENALDGTALQITQSTSEEGSKTYTIPSTVTLDGQNIKVSDYNAPTASENPTEEGYGIQFNLLNQKGFVLPTTGELGNWMFAIIGVLLLAAGVAVIVVANRKKRTEA